MNLALLASFSIFYFALTVAVAQRKPLWFDEILTYHLAKLPSISTIWTALGDGPDNSPPLNLLAVHAVYQLAGEGPVATRLPSILGVWVMSLCLYVFVARRCAPAYAWVALLFPLTTTALTYAYEGRPYGLWMGFCGLALVCWQAAAAERRRPLALAGLTLSLAATVFTHFYAPVGFIPIGLAELTRTWRRRHVDVLMWVAIVAGLVPLAFLGPMIRNAKSYADVFFSRPGLTACIYVYAWLVASALPGLVGALVGLMIDAEFFSSRNGASRQGVHSLAPMEEVVAAIGFAGFPAFTMILSRLAAGGAFVERYSLPSVIGLGVLVAFLASHLHRRMSMGYILAIAFFIGACLVGYNDRNLARFANAALSKRFEKLEALKGLPLATDDPWQYILLNYYCSPDLNRRLIYLGGTSEAHVDRCLQKLSPWVGPVKPLQIEEYDDFVAAHSQFFLFFGDSGGGLRRLMGPDRLRFELVEVADRTYIYQVSDAAASTPAPPGDAAERGRRPSGSR
ncbi:MAG TPA: glycosyltransferase family 39 protein [Isosphaeraceae bacterium]|nr:glycosyltransferase family 39 protein [Isosphaeraceae bacterium]